MLKGSTAFVTGGTGAIGAAIVRSLAKHGARTAFSFHDQSPRNANVGEFPAIGELARNTIFGISANGAAGAHPRSPVR